MDRRRSSSSIGSDIATTRQQLCDVLHGRAWTKCELSTWRKHRLHYLPYSVVTKIVEGIMIQRYMGRMFIKPDLILQYAFERLRLQRHQRRDGLLLYPALK